MNKMKFLLATLCCLFVMGSATAQFTVTCNGVGAYPGIIKMTVATTPFSQVRTFTTPGTFPLFTNPVQSFSVSVYKYNMSSGPIMWFVMPIYYWNTNSLAVNQSHQIYVDNHNGQNWYLYLEKLQSGVRCWIGN